MIDTYWSELTTVALLGTDRRQPPPIPAGALHDLAADLPAAHAADSLLRQVAAVTALRRAAWQPSQAVVPRPQVPHDDRPPTPPAAGPCLHRIIAHWPVLLAEWLRATVDNGWRVGAELVIPLLVAVRSKPALDPLAREAIGPLADWLLSTWPGLAAPTRRPPSVPEDPLPVTPELVALGQRPPAQIAVELVAGVRDGRYAVSHQAVLVNFIARVPAGALAPLAETLSAVERVHPSSPIAHRLADLAALRHHALTILERR